MCRFATKVQPAAAAAGSTALVNELPSGQYGANFPVQQTWAQQPVYSGATCDMPFTAANLSNFATGLKAPPATSMDMLNCENDGFEMDTTDPDWLEVLEELSGSCETQHGGLETSRPDWTVENKSEPDWTGEDRSQPDWTGEDRSQPDWTGENRLKGLASAEQASRMNSAANAMEVQQRLMSQQNMMPTMHLGMASMLQDYPEAFLEMQQGTKRVRTQADIEAAIERVKQKRRESAQRSRARKGAYVKTLEIENVMLKQEIAQLRNALSSLLGRSGAAGNPATNQATLKMQPLGCQQAFSATGY